MQAFAKDHTQLLQMAALHGIPLLQMDTPVRSSCSHSRGLSPHPLSYTCIISHAHAAVAASNASKHHAAYACVLAFHAAKPCDGFNYPAALLVRLQSQGLSCEAAIGSVRCCGTEGANRTMLYMKYGKLCLQSKGRLTGHFKVAAYPAPAIHS